jgi:hypothetical protein
MMVTEVASKEGIQPASHSWPIEIREPEARWGKMWAARAAGGGVRKIKFGGVA